MNISENLCHSSVSIGTWISEWKDICDEFAESLHQSGKWTTSTGYNRSGIGVVLLAFWKNVSIGNCAFVFDTPRISLLYPRWTVTEDFAAISNWRAVYRTENIGV